MFGLGLNRMVRNGSLLNQNPAFIFTVDTTKAGSATDSFVLPTAGAGYDAVVEDWGDGTSQALVGTPGNVTHVYPAPGIYQVKITGVFPYIYFNNGGDKLKIVSLDNWGITKWVSLTSSFRGCANMVAKYRDFPDLSLCTTTNQAFNGCKLFNGRIDNWDMSGITNPGAMWYEAEILNSSVAGWDTSSMTTLGYLFYRCYAFKQSLASFDVSNVTDATSMLSFVDINNTGTTDNYDATLISWASQNVKSNVVCNFGNSKYSPGAATAARDVLISKGWQITDGGQQAINTSLYSVSATDFEQESIDEDYIKNAILMPNEEMYAGKSGKVVKIDKLGIETTVLTIPNSNEWKGMWRAKDNSVYVSPHNSCAVADRGIYKKAPVDTEFRKVLSLYDGVTNHRDTIWRFTQDNSGNLYAGVYALDHLNPVLYKSTDNGETWSIVFDFSIFNAGTNHIHECYNCPFTDKLYVAVGDTGSQVYVSDDGGVTFTNISEGKMVQITAITSDSLYRYFITDKPYQGKIYRTSNDIDISVVYDGWYLDGFAMRRSDVTGWIYAFNIIDGSIASLDRFPPVEAITDPAILESWKQTNPSELVYWQDYYDRLNSIYPVNSIRPTEYTILVSKDNGDNWEELLKLDGDYSEGFNTTSFFMDGKLITGHLRRKNGVISQFPSVVIQESI